MHALFPFLNVINDINKNKMNSTEINSMLQKDNNLVILDVRTSDEFNKGHLKGAINIDIRQPDATKKIDNLDHNLKYIVHCHTNHRSMLAADYMVKNGFNSVNLMMDGYLGWVENKFEIQL
jgi:phage shock protein E